MAQQSGSVITVETVVQAPIEDVWELWTSPEHIVNWNKASDDWHTPKAENELRPGGKFLYRMEATDGSTGFDFSGTYTEVEEGELIMYLIDGGRKVSVSFEPENDGTRIVESFEAEDTHSIEMQEAGWQAILDQFKRYAEGRNK
jgi:uncharacterized protein YndB with AHSA1/START domain